MSYRSDYRKHEKSSQYEAKLDSNAAAALNKKTIQTTNITATTTTTTITDRQGKQTQTLQGQNQKPGKSK